MTIRLFFVLVLIFFVSCSKEEQLSEKDLWFSLIIENYEIINLHPSLLPKYKGLMTHKRMLINKENKYGYSIHKVTKYLDDGEILNQNQRNISNYDEDELSLNHKRLEHQFVFKDLISFLN